MAAEARPGRAGAKSGGASGPAGGVCVGTVAGTACAGAPWGRALQTLATRSAPCLGRTFQLNLKKKKKKRDVKKKGTGNGFIPETRRPGVDALLSTFPPRRQRAPEPAPAPWALGTEAEDEVTEVGPRARGQGALGEPRVSSRCPAWCGAGAAGPSQRAWEVGSRPSRAREIVLEGAPGSRLSCLPRGVGRPAQPP